MGGLLTNVVLAPLHADHLDSRVLYRGGSIAFESFNWFVWKPFAVNLHCCNVLPLIRQQDLVTHIDVFRLCVQHNWQAEQ